MLKVGRPGSETDPILDEPVPVRIRLAAWWEAIPYGAAGSAVFSEVFGPPLRADATFQDQGSGAMVCWPCADASGGELLPATMAWQGPLRAVVPASRAQRLDLHGRGYAPSACGGEPDWKRRGTASGAVLQGRPLQLDAERRACILYRGRPRCAGGPCRSSSVRVLRLFTQVWRRIANPKPHATFLWL